ncbi:MAG TPA: hypothetical protein VKY89_20790 [Thermoanaerobaculia bacterium]|nr:hypothetical protein [Thermoanaerobaculia bacterium]
MAHLALAPLLHDEVATRWVIDNVHDSLAAFDADLHARAALAVGRHDPDPDPDTEMRRVTRPATGPP